MDKRLKTLGKLSALGLALWITALPIGKRLALNAMGHSSFGSPQSRPTELNQYFFRGPFKGFYNGYEHGGVFGKLPAATPDMFEADPNKKHGDKFKDFDLNAVYLGLQKNPLDKSEHKPMSLTGAENLDFYSIKPFIKSPKNLVGEDIYGLAEGSLERILHLEIGEALSYKELSNNGSRGIGWPDFTNIDLADYTMSFGKDEKGIYTSIYDKWDFSPDAGSYKIAKERKGLGLMKLGATLLPKFGKPIHFYDRLYWSEHGVNMSQLKNKLNKNTKQK